MQVSNECNKSNHSEKLQMSKQKQSKYFLDESKSFQTFHSFFSKQSVSSQLNRRFLAAFYIIPYCLLLQVSYNALFALVHNIKDFV